MIFMICLYVAVARKHDIMCAIGRNFDGNFLVTFTKVNAFGNLK